MRELHYPFSVSADGVLLWHDSAVPWYNPATPPLLATEERSPSDVEKTITDVLGDLRGKAVSGGAAKQIRDAAADRVKQVESDQSFHRAIKGGS